MIIAAMTFAMARGISPVGIDSLKFDRSGDFMVVDMDLDLGQMEVGSSKAQVITPMIVSAHGDTLRLPSVSIYGRQRYLNMLRNDRPLTGEGETAFRMSDRPERCDYVATVPFAGWMDASTLVIDRRLYGCTNCLLDETTDAISIYKHIDESLPKVVYIDPKDTGELTDSIQGASYIDFVVDRTDINPDYRRNPQELMKIQASIDTVLNDKDVTITQVFLKGYASPESPYAHNSDLARGRTEALKEHIRQLYDFDPSIIVTAYEPEDWAGLRKAVTASNIDHKAEIIELIDSDMDPDAKEALIKKRFPKEYKFMLSGFYPALRHTDYRINYTVKRFDDVDKIRQVMHTRPNRLTLREFHILANACDTGSDEYNEVFETAVRMYPSDPVANINAANAALKRKDYDTADRYLARAGNSEEAVYARGALAFAKGDYAAAREILGQLPDMKVAGELIEEIDGIRAYNESRNQNQKILLK